MSAITARGPYLQHKRQNSSFFLSLVALVACLVFPTARQTSWSLVVSTIQQSGPNTVWGEKPVLGYFAFTASLSGQMQSGAGLSEAQFRAVQSIAQVEEEQLALLEKMSQPVILDPNLSLWQKRLKIEALGYNQRVAQILQLNTQSLQRMLGIEAYTRLVGWINGRWAIERYLHGSQFSAATLFDTRSIHGASGPRTYKVFATRFNASKGAPIVALPDQCLKLTNGGLHTCDDKGYTVGDSYSVFMSYKKSVAARVGDSGPWNIDDNYWSSSSDPQPRRLFADLAVGMPEAQAAYYNGYNGGKDQYGRTVTAPFGIDLSMQVADDLGLPPKANDWINVSYLWTEGWGASAAKPASRPGATGAPAATQAAILPVKLATPNADGLVLHEVKPGQTLWSIAVAYLVTIQDILTWNNLAQGAIIHPGDQLIIKPKGEAPAAATGETSTLAAGTATLQGSARPARLSPTMTAASAALALTAPASAQMAGPSITTSIPPKAARASWLGQEPLLIIIGFLLGSGALLLLLGRLMMRRS